MECPAQSENLKIIVNVWRKLKIDYKKHAHNITSVTKLEEAIRNIWMVIDVNFIRNLHVYQCCTNAIPNCIQTVIKTNGNMTKYLTASYS